MKYIEPHLLSSMQDYPDRGLVKENWVDDVEKTYLCGYCHINEVDSDTETCIPCQQILKELG